MSANTGTNFVKKIFLKFSVHKLFFKILNSIIGWEILQPIIIFKIDNWFSNYCLTILVLTAVKC